VAAADARYDPAARMIARHAGSSYNYHSALRDTQVHPTRDSLDYAVAIDAGPVHIWIRFPAAGFPGGACRVSTATEGGVFAVSFDFPREPAPRTVRWNRGNAALDLRRGIPDSRGFKVC
jgi:hypothetical protein